MSISFSRSQLESIIKANSSPQSHQRGKDYCEEGYVCQVIRRENLLEAKVEGSQEDNYLVSVHLSSSTIESATCTCPYDWGGWCKHIIATLYYYQLYPQNVLSRPSLEQLLARLNPLQLQRLITELVNYEPTLIEPIENWVNRLAPSSLPASSSRQQIDTKSIRRKVLRIISDEVRYLEEGWNDLDNVHEELSSLIDDAQALIEQGDVENALLSLEAITETCTQNWDEADNYGIEAYETAKLLNQVFTEAFLSIELDEADQVDWEVKLQFWENEWSVDFSMSRAALEQGWDYPPLQRVLQGEITTNTADETNDPIYYAAALTSIRLKILSSQQRYEEYLYLAKAEGQIESYLTCLARLGRIETAMSEAQQLMTTTELALALAKILLELGELEKALTIAKAGLLTQEGDSQAELGRWTVELAEQLNDVKTILMAQIKTWEAQPSLSDYQKLKQLAGSDWSNLQKDLLDYLRSYDDWYGQRAKVDIFLEEHLIDEAITLLDNDSYLLDQSVLKKIIPYNAEWVIKKAISQAERIMNSGKAKYYDAAVDWLKQARQAYYQANNIQGWQNYYQELKNVHGRKYKLMGLLKPLI
ncbi:MAG: SWIM zinc finger family protein [Prochloraceae cyanobacterium]|nr:SWIM zinc finger family protein [Prochloraceae cyanobacterium]